MNHDASKKREPTHSGHLSHPPVPPTPEDPVSSLRNLPVAPNDEHMRMRFNNPEPESQGGLVQPRPSDLLRMEGKVDTSEQPSACVGSVDLDSGPPLMSHEEGQQLLQMLYAEHVVRPAPPRIREVNEALDRVAKLAQNDRKRSNHSSAHLTPDLNRCARGQVAKQGSPRSPAQAAESGQAKQGQDNPSRVSGQRPDTSPTPATDPPVGRNANRAKGPDGPTSVATLIDGDRYLHPVTRIVQDVRRQLQATATTTGEVTRAKPPSMTAHLLPGSGIERVGTRVTIGVDARAHRLQREGDTDVQLLIRDEIKTHNAQIEQAVASLVPDAVAGEVMNRLGQLGAKDRRVSVAMPIAKDATSQATMLTLQHVLAGHLAIQAFNSKGERAALRSAPSAADLFEVLRAGGRITCRGSIAEIAETAGYASCSANRLQRPLPVLMSGGISVDPRQIQGDIVPSLQAMIGTTDTPSLIANMAAYARDMAARRQEHELQQWMAYGIACDLDAFAGATDSRKKQGIHHAHGILGDVLLHIHHRNILRSRAKPAAQAQIATAPVTGPDQPGPGQAEISLYPG